MDEAPDQPDRKAREVQYLLLSDVHLTEVLSSRPEGWWSYKSREARQDRSLVDLLELADRQRPSSFRGTCVVFDGDTWDFDSVQSTPGGDGPVEGLPFTVAGSVWKMRRLAADHDEFLHGLARFLAGGNRAVFVLGNHDRELAFAEVQEVLRERLARVAPPGSDPEVALRVSFEPWFVHVPGVFFAEHGQQYDTTCSYRDVLDPFAPADRRNARSLDASLGSIIGRHVLSRLGTFNPYDDDSFLKSLRGYLQDAMRYYWPRKPFLTTYVRIAFRVAHEARSARRRALASRRDTSQLYEGYARRKGVEPAFVDLLRRLASPPIADRLHLLWHELWVDRFLLVGATLAILGFGILKAESWKEGLVLLALVPVLAFVLRALGRGSLALQERGRWGLVAEHVSARLGVPVVAFGHSHRPERRPLRNGGRYYNLGTWAPVHDPEAGRALLRARRFLVIRAVAPGRVWVAFQRWDEAG